MRKKYKKQRLTTVVDQVHLDKLAALNDLSAFYLLLYPLKLLAFVSHSTISIYSAYPYISRSLLRKLSICCLQQFQILGILLWQTDSHPDAFIAVQFIPSET